jgi:hypothetical protein
MAGITLMMPSLALPGKHHAHVMLLSAADAVSADLC